MSRFNEGGMHYISYHRKNKEFDNDNAFINQFSKTNKKESQKEIIYYKGKAYQVIKTDENGNKTVVPYNLKKKRHKLK